jgi:hypothetical protein
MLRTDSGASSGGQGQLTYYFAYFPWPQLGERTVYFNFFCSLFKRGGKLSVLIYTLLTIH